tara:strand:+ start:50 stop:1192 length:1143 start_codon:yes stop_codon:yes gene_type:complete
MGINSDFQFKQEGGEVLDAPMMPPPQPQEGADMQNLGFVNDPNAMPPQEGGEMSVADDIPREADEGDFILPYETVLLIGLKQLNRYAKEAMKLASENNVDLSGTQLDPTDDVPIKISNYEYHIPKVLVPFFGGGKKYLDKIQKQGLDLRKRLQEEGMPDLMKEQEAEAPQMEEAPPETADPAMMMPPQPQGMIPQPEASMMMPPQEAPPPPMMQKGGFVLSKDQDAAMLEKDKAPTTQEQTRLKAQQPAMMTPDGKRVQQGFSAPAGYNEGGELEKTSQQVPDWVKRALDPSSPIQENEDGSISTVRTQSSEVNGKIYLYPTLRKQGDKLIPSDLGDALKKKDFIEFSTEDDATKYSKQLSDQIYGMRGLQKASGGFVTR